MGRTSDAREKLLQVAFDLISDYSYGSVSIDQICEKAQVNKGSFYYFFRTKADLTIGAYELQWERKKAELDKVFSIEHPPLERISRWCDYILAAQREKSKRYGHVCGCPFASVGVELATQDERLRAKVEELIDRSVAYLEKTLADAISSGEIESGDPRQTALQVYSYVLGSLLQAKIRNELTLLRKLEPTILAMLGAKTLAS